MSCQLGNTLVYTADVAIYKQVHIHNYDVMIFGTACYERPPVLRDWFCCAEEEISQEVFTVTLSHNIYLDFLKFYHKNGKGQ